MTKKSKDTVSDQLDALSSSGSLGQRIDDLGQELIANAFFLIDKRRKGEKITEEEDSVQTELMNQFKILEAVYMKLKRMGRISEKQNDNFDEQLVQKIQNKKSTLGNIVTGVPNK